MNYKAYKQAFQYFLNLEKEPNLFSLLNFETKTHDLILSIDLPEIKTETPYFKNDILSKFALIKVVIKKVSITKNKLALFITEENANCFVKYINNEIAKMATA